MEKKKNKSEKRKKNEEKNSNCFAAVRMNCATRKAYMEG
jgi:hypothetical protein